MMTVADLHRIERSFALLLVMTVACGDSGGGSASDSTTGTSVTTAPTTVTPTTGDSAPTSGDSATGSSSEPGGSDSATGSTGSTSSGTTTDDVLKLDVGAGTTSDETGAPPEKGCRKVDFLFVIDNSGSMSEEQANLIASFPSFIETIQQELEEATDYHIMVVDSDAYVFGGCPAICPLFFDLCPGALNDYQCGVTQPEECEDILGAGVVHPKGENSSSKDCSFVSKARYMDLSEPDLAATFACAAQVGTGSTDDPEKVMQAMVAAVAPKGDSAECNAGFLRQDAILVVTYITDEDDNAGDGSLGTVEGWHASLTAAKKGDETALVVLGLFGDGDKPDAICGNAAEPSPRLRAFVESFGDHGVAGSVCAPSYKEFFQKAVGIIDETCDDFVPPPM